MIDDACIAECARGLRILLVIRRRRRRGLCHAYFLDFVWALHLHGPAGWHRCRQL